MSPTEIVKLLSQVQHELLQVQQRLTRAEDDVSMAERELEAQRDALDQVIGKLLSEP